MNRLKRFSRSVRGILSCQLFFAALAFAQWMPSVDPTAPSHGDLPESKTAANRQNSKPLVFSSHAEYVLVPVIVQDKDRKHVSGLSKSDFVVLEGGRNRPIASVEEIHTASALGILPTSATGTASSNVPAANADAAKRIAIIVLDLINTPNNEQASARRAVIDLMLHTAERGTLIQLLTINGNGVTVIHDFTEHPQELLAALRDVQTELSEGQAVKGSSSSPIMKDALDKSRIQGKEKLLAFAREADTGFARAQEADAAALTLQAFQRIAQNVTGIRGRKSLVWITASFPFQIDNRKLANTNVAQSFEHTMQLLNEANISVYPVDVHGLPTLGLDGSEHLPVGAAGGPALQRALSSISVSNSSRLSTMLQVAEMTGGQAFYNRNDIDTGVMQGLQDGADYYMLSYPLDKANLKPGWRDLTVHTKDGYTVRARRGFYVTQATVDPSLTRSYDLDNALASPLPFTSLPLKAALVGAPQDSQKGKVVTFEIDLPPGTVAVENKDDQLNLDFRVAATDAHGDRAGGVAQSINSGLTPESIGTLQKEGLKYKNSFELPPGEYTLHFVVRDNATGRVGSVITHVKVG